ncbi:MAG: hypothetical protein U0K35_05510 [Prevotella sp.]|nr:hypothetical protein [Prevotella sp.]
MQIEKSQSLLKGVSMNIDKAVSCGITCEQLRKLEHITAETDKINKELDAMCLAVSEKAAQDNIVFYLCDDSCISSFMVLY